MRTFYTLIITQTLSLIGSRISSLAIGIWIFQQTGEATPLGLVAFFHILPTALAYSLSGVLADRYDRRYVMAISDTGQAVGTLLLLVSFVSGNFQLWHLYLITLFQAVFGVFQGPAFSASITMLVPDEHRNRANAIVQLSQPSAGIIAPAIAGFIYGLVGVPGAIIIDMATFVAAMIVVLMVRIPHPEQTAEGRAMQGSFLKELAGGMRYLAARKPLLVLCLHVSVMNFLLNGAITVLFTPYILARTGSTATLGVLLGLPNISALASGILFGIWGGTRPRIHTVMVAALAASLFMIVLGAAQTPVVIGMTLLLLVFPTPMFNASIISLLQAKVAPDIQGRVFATVNQIGILLAPISYVLLGPLADRVFEPAVGKTGWETIAPLVGNSPGSGMGMVFVVTGAVGLILSAVIYALPMIRHMEADLPDYAPSPAAATETAPAA